MHYKRLYNINRSEKWGKKYTNHDLVRLIMVRVLSMPTSWMHTYIIWKHTICHSGFEMQTRENIQGTKQKETSFWKANFVFVQLRQFFSLKISNFAGWNFIFLMQVQCNTPLLTLSCWPQSSPTESSFNTMRRNVLNLCVSVSTSKNLRFTVFRLVYSY